MEMKKGLRPSPVLLYKNEGETLVFKSIVVPASMRSPLWQHFGFPANENREILTKTKIICCICYAHIAYNRNTTNLSTHLKNKHPEILQEIRNNAKDENEQKCDETSIAAKRFKAEEEMTVNWVYNEHSGDDSKVMTDHPTGITRKTFPKGKKATIYKPKFQITEEYATLSEESSTPSKTFDHHLTDLETNEHEHDNEFIETIQYASIDEDTNEIITEVMDADSVANANRSNDEFLSSAICQNANFSYSPKKIIIATKSTTIKVNDSNTESNTKSRSSDEVMGQIKKFLIKDLCSSSIVDGIGFKEMIAFFSLNADIPTSLQVVKSIEADYKQQRTKAISHVKSIIQNRNFSVLFHKLGNSSTVEISVNYWMDDCDRISPLDNRIFCITKNCANTILSFEECLENCSAFVVDFDLESELSGMEASITEIPIIPTFSYVMKLAFEACMEMEEVQTAVEWVDAILGDKVKTSHTWLQKFEILSQYLNEVDSTENIQIIQVVIECLQPLKNCLDVLAFEASAYASIMKPVVLQLINQHYSDSIITESSDDSDIYTLEMAIKKTILKVFQQSIINSPFLAVASFLDPRFQRLTAPEDIQTIRDELEKNVEIDYPKQSEHTLSESRSDVKQTKSKLSLSSLFTNLSPIEKPKPPKNRFDIEFRSYTEDVSLDMELCPLEWWAENETLYPILKQHVKKYFCVPSFVNNVHRLPLHEQEELEMKYHRIDCDEPSEKLLWLHLNELRRRSFET